MNRNKKIEISEIASVIATLKNDKNVADFMIEILTETELETLSKRWQILKMLNEGRTQRDIAQELKVSLCKVTRGSKILKNRKSIVTKCLVKEKKDEQ